MFVTPSENIKLRRLIKTPSKTVEVKEATQVIFVNVMSIYKEKV